MKKGKTYYISGPMRGYPELNYPAFQDSWEYLSKKYPDSNFINPVDLSKEVELIYENPDWEDYLEYDIECIENKCDGIIMILGWEKSEGANLEKYVAEKLGLEIFYFGVME